MQSDYATENLVDDTASGALVSEQGEVITSGTGSTINNGHGVGVKGLTVHNGTATLAQAIGTEGAVQNDNTGTITNAVGVQSYFQGNDAGGSITNLYGFEAGSSAANSGAIGQWVDFYSPNIGTNGSGTMGTEYTLLNQDPNKILQTAGQTILMNASTTQLTTSGNAYLATSGGNVGIGTTTPQVELSVNGIVSSGGSTLGAFQLLNTSGAVRGTLQYTGSVVNLSSANSLPITFSPNGTEAMRVVSGGDVGIGTTTPYAPLEVWGPNTATTSAFTVANSASTTVFSVYDNGNAIYSGSLFQSSDERLKTDIIPLDASSSLAAIEGLTPVSYIRIDQPDQGTNSALSPRPCNRFSLSLSPPRPPLHSLQAGRSPSTMLGSSLPW